MKGARRFRDRLKKDLENPEFKKAFDEEEVFASVAIQVAKLREKEGLTQQGLAKLLHTSQQAVSRLEDPDSRSYSLRTLVKIAHAFNKELKVELR